MTEHVVGRGVVDTSAIINLADIDVAVLPEECLISAITLAELSVGALVATNSRQRAARQAHLQAGGGRLRPDPVRFFLRTAGRVAASLRRSGRKAQARAYDALIAATAVAHDLPVFTRNPDDFEGIDGLTVHTA